jgi:hypothetical protein
MLRIAAELESRQRGMGIFPVQVRVSDQRRLHDLIRYLREAGCVAEQAGANMLDVFMPSVPDLRRARLQLGTYLTAWRIRNPGVETQLLMPPPRA